MLTFGNAAAAVERPGSGIDLPDIEPESIDGAGRIGIAVMSTMDRIRAWRGPALLSFGFRPFFLFGACHAAISVAVWVAWLLGGVGPPTAFPPVAWHAHELLFGYVPAIVAGFLLTAVPNWTGRLPVVGWPLAGLFAIWLAGRVAVAMSLIAGPWVAALASLAFPVALVAVIGREIIASRNRRNLKVIAVVVILLAAQALFHWEVWRFGYSTYGGHAGMAATLLLIMLIGGRIVPSFTGNWLKKRGGEHLPAGFSRFDIVALTSAAAALAAWVALQGQAIDGRLAAGLLVLAGIVHLVRLARWQPHRTAAEPLVTVLHAGYAFVPLGFLLAGYAAATGDPLIGTGAVHAWTTGAIGTMTLAVMTRATLGHTGRPLAAGPATVAIYGAVIVSALARVAAALVPQWGTILVPLAGIAWVGAFAGFAAVYGPMLLSGRVRSV